jgi:hypothetical protein
VLCPFPDGLLNELPLLIFEEMSESFAKFDRKTHTSEDGGAFPGRIPHIEHYHILEPKQEQVYFCHGLHKTPHYSIPALQLQQYKDHIVLNGVDLASKVTLSMRAISRMWEIIVSWKCTMAIPPNLSG